MIYKRIEPHDQLSNIIECYWIIENDDPTVIRQKIIPDGYPELIFHYRDPYRINIDGNWERQEKYLLAGQIRNHFFLENTGASGMLGIKLKPAAAFSLFGIEMHELTDKVVDGSSRIGQGFQETGRQIGHSDDLDQKLEIADQYIRSLMSSLTPDHTLGTALNILQKQNGLLSISELTQQLKVGERKLERLFRKQIGLSPKFYTRVIRFNYIFELVQKEKMSWSELAHKTGFYDQSHFIKNFQEFTGEDPTNYFFDEENMANFFMKKNP